jgi:hypothetical protein
MSSLLLIGLGVACEEEQETIGIISIDDIKGDPVHGALVRVYGDPSDSLYAQKEVRVDKEGRTNSSGTVEFSFEQYYKDGQSGLMVLDVEVKKDSLTAEDYIEIVHGEKNEKRIVLEP